ncbi:TPA: hypothetical protein ACH3X1_002754 [Trebouxia sp. C0004]
MCSLFSISIIFGSALFLVQVPVLSSVFSIALYHLSHVHCVSVSIVPGLAFFSVQLPFSALFLALLCTTSAMFEPLSTCAYSAQLCQSDFNARSELWHPSQVTS